MTVSASDGSPKKREAIEPSLSWRLSIQISGVDEEAGAGTLALVRPPGKFSGEAGEERSKRPAATAFKTAGADAATSPGLSARIAAAPRANAIGANVMP